MFFGFIVVKPWLICGYHVLTSKHVFGFIVVKPWLICGYHGLTSKHVFFVLL